MPGKNEPLHAPLTPDHSVIIVQIGETVQFDCNARPTADVQGKLFMVLLFFQISLLAEI